MRRANSQKQGLGGCQEILRGEPGRRLTTEGQIVQAEIDFVREGYLMILRNNLSRINNSPAENLSSPPNQAEPWPKN